MARTQVKPKSIPVVAEQPTIPDLAPVVEPSPVRSKTRKSLANVVVEPEPAVAIKPVQRRVSLDITDISTHAKLQGRVTGISSKRVSTFLDDVLRNNLEFTDPLEVVWDGEHYWLYDGYTRREAYRAYFAEIKRTHKVICLVTDGDFELAELLSFKANLGHKGLPRNSEDNFNIVKRCVLHPRWGRLEGHPDVMASTSAIAEFTGVHEATVRRYIKRMEQSGLLNTGNEDLEQPRLRATKDGRVMDVRKIGSKTKSNANSGKGGTATLTRQLTAQPEVIVAPKIEIVRRTSLKPGDLNNVESGKCKHVIYCGQASDRRFQAVLKAHNFAVGMIFVPYGYQQEVVDFDWMGNHCAVVAVLFQDDLTPRLFFENSKMRPSHEAGLILKGVWSYMAVCSQADQPLFDKIHNCSSSKLTAAVIAQYSQPGQNVLFVDVPSEFRSLLLAQELERNLVLSGSDAEDLGLQYSQWQTSFC